MWVCGQEPAQGEGHVSQRGLVGTFQVMIEFDIDGYYFALWSDDGPVFGRQGVAIFESTRIIALAKELIRLN